MCNTYVRIFLRIVDMMSAILLPLLHIFATICGFSILAVDDDGAHMHSRFKEMHKFEEKCQSNSHFSAGNLFMSMS